MKLPDTGDFPCGLGWHIFFATQVADYLDGSEAPRIFDFRCGALVV